MTVAAEECLKIFFFDPGNVFRGGKFPPPLTGFDLKIYIAAHFQGGSQHLPYFPSLGPLTNHKVSTMGQNTYVQTMAEKPRKLIENG